MKQDTITNEFLDLLEKHQGIVHKVCRIYERAEEDRKDLFQQIICNAWQGYQRFRKDAQFSTWLHKVALNTALSYKRKTEHQASTKQMDSLDKVYHIAEKGQEPMPYEDLYSAIAQLNKVEKAIIFLYLEDKSYQDIAEITGITEGNLRVKLNRIRKKLKLILETS
ncbi:RNA polymerase sigma factor [Sediminitomix flava]|uniref:RNA polymerase sigma factor n=1 Tax=Sediminitomix flava TaxID=379075 RepID=UPI001B86CCC2|nr:sigma-70 family RNA polymerase sigma factor [Sediminitomix flava]